ncbi:MAG TPA: ABC transporter permease [Beijerinckiaceae bacterium]|nr:ABC transporter permease [Beijerinckiaceae bacterium]
MNLVVHIAWTHIRHRLRQTLVGTLGIATGVGFSIMMASLMVGSQRDFIATLVDTLPHVSIRDEQRHAQRQPAENAYDVAAVSGVRPDENRPGLKNPLALVNALEGWVPGAVATSVTTRAIVRYAGRDLAATVLGIDPRREPRVSSLPKQMRQGTLAALNAVPNGIIIGDGLMNKLGARQGATLALVPATGVPVDARIAGVFHSGVRAVDEGQIYTLTRTAQILAGQTGLINEIRIRLDDAMQSRDVAALVEAQVGYKALSWQEANEDLMSAFMVRNIIMFTVVGAILLVASFGTYNIVSTITHEKTRDIAIMKALGLPRATVRRIFVLEALLIGVFGAVLGCVLGNLMTQALGQVEIKVPFGDATTLPVIYDGMHYLGASLVAMASSLIAGFLPARKAAALHPVDIIRGAT